MLNPMSTTLKYHPEPLKLFKGIQLLEKDSRREYEVNPKVWTD